MRHYTEEDVLADIEALGLTVVNPRLQRAFTAMLNNPAFPPRKTLSSDHDCVVSWAPGWRP